MVAIKTKTFKDPLQCFNHHIHVHWEEVKTKMQKKKLMQEKKFICRMLPKILSDKRDG
jgi:hypothetical protein